MHAPSVQFLSVALLSPGFLIAGAALAAAPIIIHLLNRRRFRVVPWAAMEFLLAAVRKNRRRLRFESWFLLAVRCAALFLLGLALARPMGCGSSSLAAIGQRTSLNVFIIDNSYSMGYEHPRGLAKTHLDQAKVIAHAMISRLESGSEGVVLLTAGAPSHAVIAEPTFNLPAANSAVDAIPQTAAATDLPGAMQLALHIAQHNSALPNKHLYFLTDSTRSALENSQSADLRTLAAQLAAQYKLTYFNLGLPNQQNLAVNNLHASDSLVTTKFPTQLLADVHGFNITSPAALQWKLDGQTIGAAQSAASPTGIAAALDHVSISTGGAHWLTVSAPNNDPLPIDNIAYRVINAASQMKVLLVEGDRGSSPMSGSAAFLSIALDPTQSPGKISDSYVQPTTISDLQLTGEILGNYRAVVLANVPTIDPHEADALRQYVSAGGTLMIFMGELVNPDNYNQVLLSRGLLPGPLQRRMTAPANSPFTFDFHPNGPLHPILQFLHNQPRSGLETTEITSYWQVNLPTNSKAERVLDYARLASSQRDGSSTRSAAAPLTEDPAITLQSLGSGRVLFFSTTADAQWTTLPAKPVYVPLMHELLQGSIVSNDQWMNLLVGDRLLLPARITLTAPPRLATPDGQQITLQLTPTASPVYQSPPLAHPGIYTLNTGANSYPIAVNPPPEEADVRTESASAVRSIFGNVPMDIQGDQPPAEIAQINEGRDFGWTAMLIVLGLLGAECFMAMKFGHYRKEKRILTTDGLR